MDAVRSTRWPGQRVRHVCAAMSALIVIAGVRGGAMADLGRELVVPPVTGGEPAAGVRVRQSLPAYRDTGVHHLLYLPTDWKPGGRFPVIVEYPGNHYGPDKHGDVCTGLPEGCKLGYGQSGGRGFIWLCLPFVNTKEKRNQPQWWGDVDATVAYCVEAVHTVCRDYGGDEKAVILTGFSRGAIACSFIGLHDDRIAGLWRGFIASSHFDGVNNWGYAGADRASALQRLARLRGRPVLVAHETPGVDNNAYLKRTALDATRDFVKGIDAAFTFLPIDWPRHSDAWVLEDRPERRKVRQWLADVLAHPAAPEGNTTRRDTPPSRPKP